jgi:hypothetical protein
MAALKRKRRVIAPQYSRDLVANVAAKNDRSCKAFQDHDLRKVGSDSGRNTYARNPRACREKPIQRASPYQRSCDSGAKALAHRLAACPRTLRKAAADQNRSGIC